MYVLNKACPNKIVSWHAAGMWFYRRTNQNINVKNCYVAI